ncbi:MAG: hypothetical protein QNL04_04515 [SAR324 cluster bacterium]|nr:hypothetical protein [SAR324 cluster bacterium]
MATMLGEVKCSNTDCNKTIEFHHDGMQYANCKYQVQCTECDTIITFSGTGTRKFLGETLGDRPEAKEIEG